MASPRRLRAGSPTPLACASILRILSSPAPCLLMPQPHLCPEDDSQERMLRLTRLCTSRLARCDLPSPSHDVPLRRFCSHRLSAAGPGHIAGRRPFFSALPTCVEKRPRMSPRIVLPVALMHPCSSTASSWESPSFWANRFEVYQP